MKRYSNPGSREPTLEYSLDQQSHTGFVLSTAFSPTGTRLYTGSVEGDLNILDVKTGRLVDRIEGAHSGPVLDIRSSPAGDLT